MQGSQAVSIGKLAPFEKGVAQRMGSIEFAELFIGVRAARSLAHGAENTIAANACEFCFNVLVPDLVHSHLFPDLRQRGGANVSEVHTGIVAGESAYGDIPIRQNAKGRKCASGTAIALPLMAEKPGEITGRDQRGRGLDAYSARIPAHSGGDHAASFFPLRVIQS